MAKYIIGFDLGGTKMIAGLLTPEFKIKRRCRRKTLADKGPKTLFKRIVETIRESLEKEGIGPKDLAGIGIGSPGPLDPERGIIFNASNLGLKNFPLANKLRKEFGCPVRLENDVNAGTYGEYHFGAGKGSRHLVGVFPGTGIGGGLVLDGNIYRGASGAAGEIGHVTIDPDGPTCACGKPGCVEAFAGRHVIASQLAVLALTGQAPHLLKETGADIRKIRSGAIRRSIEAGDKKVEKTLRRAASEIGLLCAGLVNTLSPDMLVLGGGLVEALPDIFQQEAKRSLKLHALPYLRRYCKVATAQLGDDAVILGAAKLIVETLEGHKTAG